MPLRQRPLPEPLYFVSKLLAKLSVSQFTSHTLSAAAAQRTSPGHQRRRLGTDHVRTSAVSGAKSADQACVPVSGTGSLADRLFNVSTLWMAEYMLHWHHPSNSSRLPAPKGRSTAAIFVPEYSEREFKAMTGRGYYR